MQIKLLITIGMSRINFICRRTELRDYRLPESLWVEANFISWQIIYSKYFL
jgi:hypothetical protein